MIRKNVSRVRFVRPRNLRTSCNRSIVLDIGTKGREGERMRELKVNETVHFDLADEDGISTARYSHRLFLETVNTRRCDIGHRACSHSYRYHGPFKRCFEPSITEREVAVLETHLQSIHHRYALRTALYISMTIHLVRTTTTVSPEELQRFSSFKEFLNLSSTRPTAEVSRSSLTMSKFMRSIYRQVYDETGARRRRRRKRQQDESANLHLSDETDFIVSLPNQSTPPSHSLSYQFEYNSSLEHLAHAELILPRNQPPTTIRISSATLNLVLSPPFHTDGHWLKINLTQYVTSFPLTFHLTSTTTGAQLASGFLTLYFRRATHSVQRRDLSTFYENQLVTYPDDPSYCQVRPLRTSFSELDWSSWIVEPSSYEMNMCSGTCQTAPNMATYFIIQNLLNQKYPGQVPAPCCRPKRFSSTVLLYYDGPNLVLKRHENMRVVECGCSS